MDRSTSRASRPTTTAPATTAESERIRMDRARTTSVGVAFAVALLASGCTSVSSPAPGSAPAATISQPPVRGVEVAPLQQRVDLSVPTFSDPTDITNPLFPVSQQAPVLFLGHVEDVPFRTEVTLLPNPRMIEWEGSRSRRSCRQYVAFSDGRSRRSPTTTTPRPTTDRSGTSARTSSTSPTARSSTREGTWIAGLMGRPR